MSAPVNDNFANATLIPQIPAIIKGTTDEATLEAGEPTPLTYANTVWYKVHPGTAADGVLVVSLRLNDALPLMNANVFDLQTVYNDVNYGQYVQGFTNYPATVQVFTSATGSLADLVEVAYVVNWSAGYSDQGNEAAVSFQAEQDPNRTYYIRVGARTAGATGRFLLSVFYGCSCCCGCFAPLVLLAKATPGMFAENVASFGNYPAGEYTVSYCCGAFAHTGEPSWTVYHWTGGISDSDYHDKNTVQYMSGGVLSTAFLNPTSGVQEYPTQSAAEAAVHALNPFVTFQHSGGPIGIHFEANPYNDDTAGNPNPTFGLWGASSQSTFGCNNLTLGAPTSDCSGVGTFVMQVPVTNTGTTWQAGVLTLSNPSGFQVVNSSSQFFVMPGKTVNVPFFMSVSTQATQVSGTVTLTDIAATVQCGAANFNFTWPKYNFTYAGRSAFTAVAGGDCAVTFGINFISQFCTLTNCIVSLALTGGIIKASGPLTGVTIKPGLNNFPFNFRAAITGAQVAFNIIITDQYGNQIYNHTDLSATAYILQQHDGTGVTRSGDTFSSAFFASFSNPFCPLQGCTVTLLPTGGVIAPTPLTNVTLTNGTNRFNFNFNVTANKVDIIATLAVYDNQMNLIAQLPYDLKPVLQISANTQIGLGLGYPCGPCTNGAPSDTALGLDLKNIGIGPTVALAMAPNACGCQVFTQVGILLPGVTVQLGNGLHPSRFSGHGPFTLNFTDGAYSFPAFVTGTTT